MVPAYQAEGTLGDTLDALLAQTFEDWECVVVDDGSTDGTARLADAYADRERRMRVIRQANQGTAGAYNTGTRLATGDYIVICSADDILLARHLSTLSAFIEAEPGYEIYSTNGYFWTPGGSRRLVYDIGPGAEVVSVDLADVIERCFYSVGAAFRRDLVATVGGYRPGVYGEDYDFWLRALASGARHRYLPEPLSLHRVSDTQKSARLEAVYRSDIRLLSDLMTGFALGDADKRAAEQAIRDREHLIGQLRQPRGLYRGVLRPIAKRVVLRVAGRQRGQRLIELLRRKGDRSETAVAHGPKRGPSDPPTTVRAGHSRA